MAYLTTVPDLKLETACAVFVCWVDAVCLCLVPCVGKTDRGRLVIDLSLIAPILVEIMWQQF